MSYKRWSLAFGGVVLFMLACVISVVAIIDPYFHYHAPLSILEYPIYLQRYQNDGILRSFKYDAIITGSSMTENFKTSEFDELFAVTSVKVPYAGASFKEINNVLSRALKKNPTVRYVVRGLDTGRILDEKNTMRYEDDSYPWHLYDDALYNDVKYILNKEVILHAGNVIKYTLTGGKTTTFDEYSNWNDSVTFGKEAILSAYGRPKKIEEQLDITAALDNLRGNIEQNVVSLAKEHPDVTFYYFFTPYSIFWWDKADRTNELDLYFQGLEEATRIMLEYDNIQVFSFYDDYEMICNPDNYRDYVHYSEDINSRILQWMKAGEHRITKENYVSYWDETRSFYENFDYDQLFG